MIHQLKYLPLMSLSFLWTSQSCDESQILLVTSVSEFWDCSFNKFLYQYLSVHSERCCVLWIRPKNCKYSIKKLTVNVICNTYVAHFMINVVNLMFYWVIFIYSFLLNCSDWVSITSSFWDRKVVRKVLVKTQIAPVSPIH